MNKEWWSKKNSFSKEAGRPLPTEGNSENVPRLSQEFVPHDVSGNSHSGFVITIAN